MKFKPLTLAIIAITAMIAISSGHSSAQMGKMNHNMDGMSMELGKADANVDLRFIDG